MAENHPRQRSTAEAGPRTSSAARPRALGLAFLLVTTVAAIGPEVSPATGDPRVDGLLGQMTLAEKLSLMHDAREASTTT